MELLEAYRRSLREFTDRVDQVAPAQWEEPTPCADWEVRTLVAHVVSEDRWTVPMFHGETIESVGNRFAGDQLGDNPAESARNAFAQAENAVSSNGALDRTVHLSAGDTPAPEYLRQLIAEHLIHGWDLAVAIGAEPQLDAEVVHECAEWFAERASDYRQSNLVRSPVNVSADADEQDRLLAAFGRDPNWAPPEE